MILTKNFYDKSVPTRNLVTTISGIITIVITILASLGVFTPEQASGVTEQTTTLLTLVPQVISAIAALILIFKAKD
jgi:ABC-type spermidine/putrescine transport system permease subunit II